MSSLQQREAGPEPHRDAYGPLGDYRLAWYTWRAKWHDAQLTNAERDASFRVLAERLGYPGLGLWDKR